MRFFHPGRRIGIATYIVVGAAVALMALAMFFADVAPKSSITLRAMMETSDRIGIYFHLHQHLPPNLNGLPTREDRDNRTTDAWGRPLRYVVETDRSFTLSSLGKDGLPGGVGDDADRAVRYIVVNGDVYEEGWQPTTAATSGIQRWQSPTSTPSK
jgi:hypothetical protein